MNSDKPKIACLSNGPYYLLNDFTARVVPNIQKSDGSPCSTISGVALCRCGGSSNKPFCDGTHGQNGFSDKNLSNESLNKLDNFIGKLITIHDNRSICAHAGLCTNNLSAVFKFKQEPWIDPDGATTQEIINTINKCPSGALSYTIDNAENQQENQQVMVTVSKDGPYVVSGGIELIDQEFNEGASTEQYTLCRCGNSNNKPFCDGTHWSAGFKDDNN